MGAAYLYASVLRTLWATALFGGDCPSWVIVAFRRSWAEYRCRGGGVWIGQNLTYGWVRKI